MFCHRYIVEMEKKDDIWNLRPLGDIHIGSVGFAKEKFEEQIKFIANEPNYLTVAMGDVIDNVQAYAQGMVDKRWNPQHTVRKHMTTEEQIVAFSHYWKYVAHKSVGIFSGNHEWKTITQQRFVRDFCNPVDMHVEWDGNGDMATPRLEPTIKEGATKPEVLYSNKYLGRMAYINIGFNYQGKRVKDFLVLGMHGGYSGMQMGGAVNRLKQISGDFDCDIVLMGHSHDTGIRTATRLGYDLKHNDIIRKKILLANTGTFLQSYMKNADNYEEINPREAKRVGTITVTMNPYTGNIYGHD